MTSVSAISFASTRPEELGKVLAYLFSTFHSPENDPNFSADAVRWKYFDPHPWWPGSRSFLLKAGGHIAGHGCVTPVRFVAGGQVTDSMQIIDWAGGRLVPGAGMLVFRRCLELGDLTLLTIGGKKDQVGFTAEIQKLTKV